MKTTRSDAVKGYKLDFATNTLTINYKFNKALSDFGSKEYKRYKAIMPFLRDDRLRYRSSCIHPGTWKI